MATGVNNFECNISGAQSLESLSNENKVTSLNSDSYSEEYEFNVSSNDS